MAKAKKETANTFAQRKAIVEVLCKIEEQITWWCNDEINDIEAIEEDLAERRAEDLKSEHPMTDEQWNRSWEWRIKTIEDKKQMIEAYHAVYDKMVQTF